MEPVGEGPGLPAGRTGRGAPFRPVFRVAAARAGSGIRIVNEPFDGSAVFLVETGETQTTPQYMFHWLRLAGLPNQRGKVDTPFVEELGRRWNAPMSPRDYEGAKRPR